MTSAQNPLSNLPQAEVDAIIRTKRKAREPKACYPCHTRKVKCDRNLPCDGCVKRDHADLCSYERPSKKRLVAPQSYGGGTQSASNAELVQSGGGAGGVQPATGTGTTLATSITGNISVPRAEWDNVCEKLKEMENTISTLRSGMTKVDVGHITPPGPRNDQAAAPIATGTSGDAGGDDEGIIPEREGIHAANEFGSGTTHLGSRSVLAYLLGGSSQEASQTLLEGGILPKLGLDNETATYPFIDLWSSDSSTLDVSSVCNALPDDNQCRRLFGYYRDIGAIIYPVVPDINDFENKLEQLLRNRSIFGSANFRDIDGLDQPYGMSIAYVGLLFAILASGCQSSDMPGKERELTSQVYICCSYQFLRATNFMSQPTLEAIQTLLIIGNVLSYNMNPGVSYILLGMTLRMGLALGLQVESHRFSPAEQYARRRIWWSMAWQDSHFSLSYDRPSTMAFSHPDIPYDQNAQPGQRPFFDTLCRIVSLTLEIVRGRMLSPQSQLDFAVIQTYKDKMKRILADAAPALRDPKYCTTPNENIERLGLKLHSSYITSELCRPALKPNLDMNDPALKNLRKECIAALSRTVEAYVELHSANPHASRSWIGLQRTISCAFLLAVVGESKTNPQIWNLLRRLEYVLAERAAADGASSEQMTTPRTSNSVPVTSPDLLNSPQKAAKLGVRSPSDIINGVTNIPMVDLDPTTSSEPATIPATIPANMETQWLKPLTKSLRALQKLNAAFSVHSRQQMGAGGAGGVMNQMGPGFTPQINTSGSSLNPQIPTYAQQQPAIATTRAGSVPPPTPDSSGSGEWTFPQLLDRASEYIHPPLWA